MTPRTIQSIEFSRPEYWSGRLSLIQGIFPTQGLNPDFWQCRQIIYQSSHQGSPKILELVAYPFWGSSRPRNRTGISCITGRRNFKVNLTFKKLIHLNSLIVAFVQFVSIIIVCCLYMHKITYRFYYLLRHNLHIMYLSI